jgi:cbb3-type cytochrome oxidase subunit 3
VIGLLLALLLSWTLICFLAGAVWEAYREDQKEEGTI